MTELERIREEALLTDKEIFEVLYKTTWAEYKSQIGASDALHIESYIGDLDFYKIAQAQLDKLLSIEVYPNCTIRDLIEKGVIPVERQRLPYRDESTGYDLSLEQIRIVKQMFKAGFMKVIPKPARTKGGE